MSRRTDRIADLLRSEIATLLRIKVGDPRVRLASVSSVDVTPDMRRATVWISAFGQDEERAEAVAALAHAAGFLRSELAQRLRHLRVVPELVFELDRGAEHSRRIADLLENLDDQDPGT